MKKYKIYKFDELAKHLPSIKNFTDVDVSFDTCEMVLNVLHGKIIGNYIFDYIFPCGNGVSYVFKKNDIFSRDENTTNIMKKS